MISFLAKKISQFWEKSQIIEEGTSAIYQYGIELNISSMISILLCVMFGVLFFSIVDSLIFLIVFIIVRLYSGGYHANSYFACNISMIATFISTSFCAYTFDLSIVAFLLLTVITFLIFLIYCPVENKYKPLDSYQKKKCKTITLTLHTIISATCLFLYQANLLYCKMTLFSLLAVSILVLLGKIKNSTERSIL